ncbi:hypothetical protein F5B22DRAFT_362781 [Xylaria bambusicola]|uniref:uncharacterized protein n=1 Tax=Xylaria bambusicola TaxID=326684 RepID=UPI002007C0D0|nr:uncharacterized protein F5B22DRAFT_362781 [Xylaria bambusicola]KAI0509164.1 hypothetical protein F5B22DRAFT_362781 [Xylaria bambusicola]
MPAKKATNGVASTQSTATPHRFELPALDLKFGSLTDGTDIPPPLPSPKDEELPPPPKVATKEGREVESQQPKAEANGTTNGTSPRKPDVIVTTKVGVKRSADDVPLSPALSSRGSLRRLISKTFLNHAYDEQGSTTTGQQNMSRPPSRTASVLAEEKKAKRSSGWFRRLRSHDSTGDDKSTHSQPQFESLNKKPLGPPPPMIPELSALETKVDTNLGDDLFKGIGRDL